MVDIPIDPVTGLPAQINIDLNGQQPHVQQNQLQHMNNGNPVEQQHQQPLQQPDVQLPLPVVAGGAPPGAPGTTVGVLVTEHSMNLMFQRLGARFDNVQNTIDHSNITIRAISERVARLEAGGTQGVQGVQGVQGTQQPVVPAPGQLQPGLPLPQQGGPAHTLGGPAGPQQQTAGTAVNTGNTASYSSVVDRMSGIQTQSVVRVCGLPHLADNYGEDFDMTGFRPTNVKIREYERNKKDQEQRANNATMNQTQGAPSQPQQWTDRRRQTPTQRPQSMRGGKRNQRSNRTEGFQNGSKISNWNWNIMVNRSAYERAILPIISKTYASTGMQLFIEKSCDIMNLEVIVGPFRQWEYAKMDSQFGGMEHRPKYLHQMVSQHLMWSKNMTSTEVSGLEYVSIKPMPDNMTALYPRLLRVTLASSSQARAILVRACQSDITGEENVARPMLPDEFVDRYQALKNAAHYRAQIFNSENPNGKMTYFVTYSGRSLVVYHRRKESPNHAIGYWPLNLPQVTVPLVTNPATVQQALREKKDLKKLPAHYQRMLERAREAAMTASQATVDPAVDPLSTIPTISEVSQENTRGKRNRSTERSGLSPEQKQTRAETVYNVPVANPFDTLDSLRGDDGTPEMDFACNDTYDASIFNDSMSFQEQDSDSFHSVEEDRIQHSSLELSTIDTEQMTEDDITPSLEELLHESGDVTTTMPSQPQTLDDTVNKKAFNEKTDCNNKEGPVTAQTKYVDVNNVVPITVPDGCNIENDNISRNEYSLNGLSCFNASRVDDKVQRTGKTVTILTTEATEDRSNLMFRCTPSITDLRNLENQFIEASNGSDYFIVNDNMFKVSCLNPKKGHFCLHFLLRKDSSLKTIDTLCSIHITESDLIMTSKKGGHLEGRPGRLNLSHYVWMEIISELLSLERVPNRNEEKVESSQGKSKCGSCGDRFQNPTQKREKCNLCNREIHPKKCRTFGSCKDGCRTKWVRRNVNSFNIPTDGHFRIVTQEERTEIMKGIVKSLSEKAAEKKQTGKKKLMTLEPKTLQTLAIEELQAKEVRDLVTTGTNTGMKLKEMLGPKFSTQPPDDRQINVNTTLKSLSTDRILTKPGATNQNYDKNVPLHWELARKILSDEYYEDLYFLERSKEDGDCLPDSLSLHFKEEEDYNQPGNSIFMRRKIIDGARHLPWISNFTDVHKQGNRQAMELFLKRMRTPKTYSDMDGFMVEAAADVLEREIRIISSANFQTNSTSKYMSFKPNSNKIKGEPIWLALDEQTQHYRALFSKKRKEAIIKSGKENVRKLGPAAQEEKKRRLEYKKTRAERERDGLEKTIQELRVIAGECEEKRKEEQKKYDTLLKYTRSLEIKIYRSGINLPTDLEELALTARDHHNILELKEGAIKTSETLETILREIQDLKAKEQHPTNGGKVRAEEVNVKKQIEFFNNLNSENPPL